MESQFSAEESLPSEVTNQDIEKYVRTLADLINHDRVCGFPDVAIPDEAVDFLGKDRAAFIEKSKLIVKMAREMFSDSADKAALHNTIQRLVAASEDPYQTMAVISRIWKYCRGAENSRMTPEDFQCILEFYAQEKGLNSLTYPEEFVLLPALEEWKKGKDVQQIMREIETKVQAAFDAAHDDTVAEEDAEEYLRNGRNLSALRKKFDQTVRIRQYLHQKMKPAQKNGSAK